MLFSRSNSAKFEYLRNGVNPLDLNQPYKAQKKLALDSQLELKSGKTKIGSYVLEKDGENVFIDLVKSFNDWAYTIGILTVGIGIIIFYFYITSGPEAETGWGLFAFFLIPGVLISLWGLIEAYAEYYLQYYIDTTNEKFRIRNVFLKWKEVNFEEVSRINFKGVITEGKNTTGYSGYIELELTPENTYVLMTITNNYSGLDVDLIKEGIYEDGMRLTRILGHHSKLPIKWFKFSTDN